MNKLQPPVFFLAALVSVTALHLLIGNDSLLSFPWNLVGIVPILLGSALNILAAHSLKQHTTSVKVSKESSPRKMW